MSQPKTIEASGIPVHCAHASLADVASLVPNPRNPNKHGDHQVALLARVIRHQGWRAPITVSRRSGFIVTGHGRLQAALVLGVEKVPVDEQDFATEADEWAHLIADNRLAELAETDDAAMRELIAGLDAEHVDLTGFDAMSAQRIVGEVEGINDPDAVWEGMPACENEEKLGLKVTVYFKCKKDRGEFFDIIKQPVSTTGIWHPKVESESRAAFTS